MTLGWMETAGLRFEGFTDQQIAQIDAIRPDLEHLIGVLKTEMPRINRVIPVIQMAVAVFNANQRRINNG